MRARRDDIMGCMGLDEAWSLGKDMHALPCVFVTEAMSHGPMGWSKAAAFWNTTRHHHTATPRASAHPWSTTRTAPRKTNNHATALYSTRIHMRPVHQWRRRIGEPVRIWRDDIMGVWGWMKRVAREAYARTHFRGCHRGHVPWSDGLVEGGLAPEHCAAVSHNHTIGLSPLTVHHAHGPAQDKQPNDRPILPADPHALRPPMASPHKGSPCALGVMV